MLWTHGELLSFGPAEALAWGVVDEVGGGSA